MTNKQGRNRNRIVDRKWEKIFDDYKVLHTIEKEGLFTISSTQINKYKEARLMTKFDFVASLPNIFHDNDLAILPTSRGEYVIGHFDAYEKLRTKDKDLLKNRKEILFPSWLETISPKNITSESAAINAAVTTGIIQEFMNVDKMIQTVNGRMSSGEFSYQINNTKTGGKYSIDVKNSQIEIDSGLESEYLLLLVEAKNTAVETFLIRQLFYPYQLWARQVDKKVIPVFMQYVNDTFNFSMFEFDDINDYNSLRLIERKNYIFGAEHTTMKDLMDIQKTTRIINEDNSIPFPQANTFTRIVGIIETIWSSKENCTTLEDLTLENDFVMRQAQYYSRAAIYLGLIRQADDHKYVLTDIGYRYVQSTRKKKNLIVAKQILEHRVFNETFKQSVLRGKPLNSRETYEYLDSLGIQDDSLSPVTLKRRASTISAWINYLFDLIED